MGSQALDEMDLKTRHICLYVQIRGAELVTGQREQLPETLTWAHV